MGRSGWGRLPHAPLRRAPLLVERLQRILFQGLAARHDALFHIAKPIFELVIGGRQGFFGIDVQVPGQIDDGEQQVAEFLFDASGATSADRRLQFVEFFPDLLAHALAVRPVETDAVRPFPEFLRPFEGRQGPGDARKYAVVGICRPFLGLDALPAPIVGARGALRPGAAYVWLIMLPVSIVPSPRSQTWAVTRPSTS